jgi:hypothetical protein
MNPIVFVVLAAVLIGVAFYLVALPLLREARRNTAPQPVTSEQEHLAELLAQRDAAFQALRELNFDYKVGKVTDEDFAAFEANLKQNAARSLRALDEWEAEADDELDTLMEDAILSRKGQLAESGSLEPDGRVCARCGKPAAAGDKFCGACGAALPALAAPAPREQLACPKCGEPHRAGDKFCARCGQVLIPEVAPAAQ